MVLKTAQNKEQFARRLLFASAAREGWKHLIRELHIEAPGKVLLPSYIGFTEREGSGVFDPIEDTGVAYAFYPVDRQLRVDMDAFEQQLKTGLVRVALVIHYFGFCRNDIRAIAAMCRQYKTLLVEDCAHAFQLGLEPQRLGTIGDFSFYSLHKYLATDSGGILQVNNPDYHIGPVPETSRIQEAVLEQYIRTDIAAVARKRRENYALYSRLLRDTAGIEPMYELREEDIPHNFPILVKNRRREALYFYLAEKGLTMIALYYRLIDQIAKEEFPVSFGISDDILNLPVHQDTTDEDVALICSNIGSFFR